MEDKKMECDPFVCDACGEPVEKLYHINAGLLYWVCEKCARWFGRMPGSEVDEN